MSERTIGTDEDPQHFHADLGGDVSGRLNWLRAAVLGANDGIVSTAGVVMGVAGATDDSGAILIAGIAALTAGALSMGAGEYVSVSTQRDSERSLLHLEAIELQQMPRTEEGELARMYEEKGLSPATAKQVARELTEHDALRAHADVEFGIDPDNLTNPWHAAWASMVAFTVGALLPLLVVAFVPDGVRVLVTVLSVAAALALTGFTSARIGLSPRVPAMVRNVGGGLLAMGVTYLIGMLAGTTLG
ncbi:VIT1/CCC1 family predicted Fe2+/Mn2+ transporter [Nocardioides cavernae]|uniref:VIT1/CCC1 family predicted Fe2+/Mn2+ transporter n=1 Tax=Nocardioides cavernae TaxID=1921566 RepID=A0A7Y9KR24_9ACTN|nr:VIT family protein [Nocardioides cavernae]NYE36175.1 VIT1/CCC1 family predicted Fe2+/Mn2+ transporter [Nocardioides cavernae]